MPLSIELYFCGGIRIIILKRRLSSNCRSTKVRRSTDVVWPCLIEFTFYDFWGNVRAKTLEQENDLSTWLCKLTISQ